MVAQISPAALNRAALVNCLVLLLAQARLEGEHFDGVEVYAIPGDDRQLSFDLTFTLGGVPCAGESL